MAELASIEVGAVVRVKESAGKTFGGCHAQVKAVDPQQVKSVGVQILAPSMTEFTGLFWFEPRDISTSREDWP